MTSPISSLPSQGYLEERGFEVLTSHSCRQAESIFASTKPDPAVLDYSMADGNILETLPRLHALDPSIPIIIMTGHASIELAVQAGGGLGAGRISPSRWICPRWW